MKLRIVQAEGFWAVGDVIEPDLAGVTEILIARGIAVPLDEPPPPDAAKPFVVPNKMVNREKVRRKHTRPGKRTGIVRAPVPHQ